MNLYWYFDQNWGQLLDIDSKQISSISGFPNSWISRFLAFLGLIAAVSIVLTNLYQISFMVISLSLVFLIMSLMYGFGRRATVDLSTDEVAFVQSFFGVPFHVHKATFHQVQRDTETGLLWNVKVIYAVTENEEHIPLFRGFSPSEQSTLNALWSELTEELNDRHLNDQVS